MSDSANGGDARRRERKELAELARAEERRGLDEKRRQQAELAKAEALRETEEARAKADVERAGAEAKRAKAEAKRVKAEAKYRAKETEAREDARVEALRVLTSAQFPGLVRLPEGVELGLSDTESGSDLVVRGLSKEQLERVVREIGRDVRIAVDADRRPVRSAIMRFVREGLFQTIVKVIAGLIVGYLLLRFGFAS